MKKWLKKLYGLDKVEEQNILLKQLLENKNKELANYQDFQHYVTMPVPTGTAVTRYLSDLAHQQMFSFYMMTLENEIMVLFRNGKDSEAYRGGLRVIDQIRKDMRKAAEAESKKNAKV
jgi:hypothetical protein